MHTIARVELTKARDRKYAQKLREALAAQNVTYTEYSDAYGVRVFCVDDYWCFQAMAIVQSLLLDPRVVHECNS